MSVFGAVRMAFRAVLAFLLVAALLFWPANTINWLEAWLFIALLFLYAGITGFWLLKNNPVLAEKRLSAKLPKQNWDKAILFFLGVFMLAELIAAGFDFHFAWSNVSIWLKTIGFVGVGFTYFATFLVMKENSFLARTVEIQPNQKVVSTGPYAVVRHPMYAGFLSYFVGTALALGSLPALVPGLLSAVCLIARTELEDRELQKELAGYKEYAKKVRYKLVPKIW